MKVRLVKQSGLKTDGFFKKHGGKVFEVIWKRDGGYDVDLAPLGHPGKWGWMYNDEVEVVDSSPTLRERVADTQHKIWSHWMEHLFSVGGTNPDGSYVIPADKVARWKKQMETPYSELSEEEKERDREQAHKIFAHFLEH